MVTRVVVCYTGGVGSQVIGLLADDPAFQVAGCACITRRRRGATQAISRGSTRAVNFVPRLVARLAA